jgi:hypothetical protein
VLAEPSAIFTRCGVAVILGVPLVSVSVPLSCATLPAIDGEPKQTTNQIATAKDTERRFAAGQDLIVADNDEALPVNLLIMERTFGFAGAMPASDLSTRCLTWHDWLLRTNASENLK